MAKVQEYFSKTPENTSFVDIGNLEAYPKDKRTLLFEFVEVIVAAAFLLLVFRTMFFEPYVIEKAEINSMRSTLLFGDRIFINKLVYGPKIPFIGFRLPSFSEPSPGDVLIVKLPGKNSDKKCIFRCIAKSGQSIYLTEKKAVVNDEVFDKFGNKAEKSEIIIESDVLPRDNLVPIKVPKAGAKLSLKNLNPFVAEYYFQLIKKENPNDLISWKVDLVIDGDTKNEYNLKNMNSDINRFSDMSLERGSNFFKVNDAYRFVKNSLGENLVELEINLLKNGEVLKEYIVKDDYYFLIGDNWDASYDSRFLGFFSIRQIIGRASILYWSSDDKGVRWGRLGKLI